MLFKVIKDVERRNKMRRKDGCKRGTHFLYLLFDSLILINANALRRKQVTLTGGWGHRKI